MLFPISHKQKAGVKAGFEKSHRINYNNCFLLEKISQFVIKNMDWHKYQDKRDGTFPDVGAKKIEFYVG